MSQIRRHSSRSSVVATVAIVVALGLSARMVARVMAWLTTESPGNPTHQHAAGGSGSTTNAMNVAGNASLRVPTSFTVKTN